MEDHQVNKDNYRINSSNHSMMKKMHSGIKMKHQALNNKMKLLDKPHTFQRVTRRKQLGKEGANYLIKYLIEQLKIKKEFKMTWHSTVLELTATKQLSRKDDPFLFFNF